MQKNIYFWLNLSWSFGGDFCLVGVCFVGLGPLGFCCFVLFFFMKKKKKRGEKKKKIPSSKTLFLRFWFDFGSADKSRRAVI